MIFGLILKGNDEASLCVSQGNISMHGSARHYAETSKHLCHGFDRLTRVIFTGFRFMADQVAFKHCYSGKLER